MLTTVISISASSISLCHTLNVFFERLKVKNFFKKTIAVSYIIINFLDKFENVCELTSRNFEILSTATTKKLSILLFFCFKESLKLDSCHIIKNFDKVWHHKLDSRTPWKFQHLVSIYKPASLHNYTVNFFSIANMITK